MLATPETAPMPQVAPAMGHGGMAPQTGEFAILG